MHYLKCQTHVNFIVMITCNLICVALYKVHVIVNYSQKCDKILICMRTKQNERQLQGCRFKGLVLQTQKRGFEVKQWSSQ